MAEAIKTISVARGYDVTRYALNCFGGAGGQHACDVADALAITTVLIHPLSSLLSAYGMGLADIAAQRAQGVDEPLRIDALAPRRGHRRGARRGGGRGGRRAGGRARERSRSIAGRNCAMRAPTRRSRFRSRRPRRCDARSRAPTKAASASSIATKAIVIEAVSAEAVGGAARLAERTRQNPSKARRLSTPFASSRAPPARPRDALLFAWGLARRECLFARSAWRRRRGRWAGADHRAASDDRRRTGLARRAHGRKTTC